MARNLVFDLPDGSQVLVELWDTAAPQIATRPEESAVWGPPIDASTDETFEEASL
jgi:hypothetical protein